MREIKFRGKQLEDIHETANTYASEKGTWRYGTYKYIHKFFDGVNAHMICDIYGREIMCDKNTIGQFTGLHDKNGVEIYEGDVVVFEGGKHTIIYCDYYAMFMAQMSEHYRISLFECESSLIEVIGNIHEVKE